ncbi:MAG: hypothetical protein JXR77_09955, partial [Lentisphaeria bacterium]|nr:hypothetical protein [Lentisphaeria bacterium]
MPAPCRNAILLGALFSLALGAQDQAGPSVRITSARTAESPERVAWTYTFEVEGEEVPPTLRLAFGRLNEFSLSAGQQMRIEDGGKARGILTVTATAGPGGGQELLFGVEIGPDGPLTAARLIPQPQGQTLPQAVNLREAPAEFAMRRAMSLGDVAGCPISVYVMPGQRPPNRPAPRSTAQPPAQPGEAPIEMFRKWARGVQSGDMTLF